MVSESGLEPHVPAVEPEECELAEPAGELAARGAVERDGDAALPIAAVGRHAVDAGEWQPAFPELGEQLAEPVVVPHLLPFLLPLAGRVLGIGAEGVLGG